MSWKLAPCLNQLRAEVNLLAPDRNKAADGTIGDAAHSARNSDHNAVNGVVHALDLTHDPAHGADMNAISEQIKGDRRVKYIIWDHRIYNPSVGPYWRSYYGKNPHAHHMHVSCKYGAGFENDVSRWLDEEDALMALSEAEAKELLEKTRAIFAGLFEKDDTKAKAATGRGNSLMNVAIATRNAVVPPKDGG